ncbi:TRAP transporter small permease subunit [Aurantibacter crassamenti]|uniref:TRAP transporter small permease n=1 Tax=Aurantibacter crassamenti TaxID=1837375 RepID=UPI00193A5E9C|nr:TRAP transporter small permease subunit [Aurantibacter crassamenti]MBM1105479.1 TRAP transporter small permease subunit [Aurantibacter crassamenti]
MLHKAIGRILKYGVLVSTWGLIAAVSIQVICRFTPIATPSWTEEASRILFIYAMAFAAGLAMKNNYYVHLDVFFNSFSKKAQQFLLKAIPIITFILFAIFAVYSIQFVLQGMAEKSPSMGFTMGLAFFSMFIMSVSICYYLSITIRKSFKNKNI